MDKVILHCDLNNFYASVEQKTHPEFDGMPLAVCGNPENRHGIILAKNYAAKAAGVQTGEAIWMSKQKCPNIVLVPPRFEEYARYSKQVREIYSRYTDRVESFGLDECWLDVTGSLKLFGKNGKELADEIRNTVHKETGLTISVGVSFTKVLAKLGSDLKKPDATTCLPRETYMDTIGNMSPAELIMVGKQTNEKLKKLNIRTIRDLATADRKTLRNHFGIIGDSLVDSACGIEKDQVKSIYDVHVPKSISNGTTAPRDIVSMADAKCVIYALAELIAVRLRKYNLVAKGVAVYLRYADTLTGISKQSSICTTSNATDIAENAIKLLSVMHSFPTPLRTITVSAIRLEDKSYKQFCLFDDDGEKEEKLEESVDKLRNKFGYNVIARGVTLGSCLTQNLQDDEDIKPFQR